LNFYTAKTGGISPSNFLHVVGVGSSNKLTFKN